MIKKLAKFVISAWMDRNWGGLKLRLSIKCHKMSVKCLISRCHLPCKSLRFLRLKFLVALSEKNLRLKLETWSEKTGYSCRLDVTRILINLKSLEVTRNNLDVNNWSVNYFCIFWSLTKKKKQGKKKEKLTESLHLTVKMARRSNYNIDLRKLCISKIPAETTKRL